MSDQWAYWRAALAGNPPELTLGVAGSGFYRWQQRDGTLLPVAIWTDEDGAKVAKVGERVSYANGEFCERVFAWCARNPIPHAVYRAVAERGEPWPDAAPEKPASNLPEDPCEALRIDLEAEAELVERIVTDGIADDDAAGRAAALADRIAQTGKRADELRTEEKRPHDEAAKAVQAKWKPLVDQAATLTRRLKDAIAPFLVEKRRKAQEAERAAREANPAAPVAKVKTSIAGAEGRPVALRTQRSAVIEDMAAVLMALISDPDICDLAQRKADKVARAGGTLPGIRIITEQKAA
jgi:hypothetical protein